ncbi:ferredoxin [Nocardia sp. NBC_00565]|uniref:ferredoxin n=1 Tax=Nocardia sp. NBC_00565 TaxID=2975993 RepID=UPI002E810814|nr:ferredoxin [Nocardia sp. NBC_00565]WUC04701.1 ferredoxin [Nocardia sp. NBC_00565]
MKIHADLDLCQGHAVCQAEAPEVFTVPKRGKVEILDSHPGPDAREGVDNAVRYCPTQALTLNDESSNLHERTTAVADSDRAARVSFRTQSDSAYTALERDELAMLLPELLLSGHLIDRSGMAHTIAAFGRTGMTEVAIEEWQLASPVYTRRMQRALGFTGDSVETIFKGLQLDIGAPPQFMDFRFRVDDHDHGEFWLDHCGALADVEPMGEAYVKSMCHDIEDPTFDATALATNPYAQVRPIHRPPRVPADRHPVCAWTVVIDSRHIPPAVPSNFDLIAASCAATIELESIDRGDAGRADYSGPLLSDLRFADFSKSALIRMADEVCLQHHLLALGFLIAVRERADDDAAVDIARKQFTGIAGLTATRIRDALGLGDDDAALAQVLSLHPAWNPLPYTGICIDHSEVGVRIRIPRNSGASRDGVWPALVDTDALAPLAAMARGVNPRYIPYVVTNTADELAVGFLLGAESFPEADEVAITRFSTGAEFQFTDRGIPLPLTVVQRGTSASR